MDLDQNLDKRKCTVSAIIYTSMVVYMVVYFLCDMWRTVLKSTLITVPVTVAVLDVFGYVARVEGASMQVYFFSASSVPQDTQNRHSRNCP